MGRRCTRKYHSQGIKSTGPLYKGEPGLCLERWQFWKSRFFKVKHEVDEEVSKMALLAIGGMELAERITKKRAMDLYTGERDNNRMKKLKTPVPAGYF